MSDEDAEAGPGPWSDMSQRLRRAFTGMTLDEVAEFSGVGRRNLSRYLAGQIPKVPDLVAIADGCSVSIEWLITGRGRFDRANSSTVDGAGTATTSASQIVSDTGKSRYVAIPRLNLAASAGHGALAEHEQVVEYLAFDVDFIRTRFRRDPKHLVLIEARGDSMEPTIRDGDILTVDLTPGQPLHNAQLYVLRVGENLLVKRLEQRLDGGLIVHSDNTRYGPETVTGDKLTSLNIVGEVLLVSTPPR